MTTGNLRIAAIDGRSINRTRRLIERAENGNLDAALELTKSLQFGEKVSWDGFNRIAIARELRDLWLTLAHDRRALCCASIVIQLQRAEHLHATIDLAWYAFALFRVARRERRHANRIIRFRRALNAVMDFFADARHARSDPRIKLMMYLVAYTSSAHLDADARNEYPSISFRDSVLNAIERCPAHGNDSAPTLADILQLEELREIDPGFRLAALLDASAYLEEYGEHDEARVLFDDAAHVARAHNLALPDWRPSGYESAV